MVLENKDVYIDFGKTDFYIKNAQIILNSDEIKVFDQNGTYTFTNTDIRELKIRDAEEDYE